MTCSCTAPTLSSLPAHLLWTTHHSVVLLCKILASIHFGKVPPPFVITGRSDDRGYLTCRVWSDLNQMCSDKHISEFKTKTDPKNGVWFLRLTSTQTPGRTLKIAHVHHCLFKSHYTKLLYLFIIYNTSLIAFFFLKKPSSISWNSHQIYAFTTCFCKLLD